MDRVDARARPRDLWAEAVRDATSGASTPVYRPQYVDQLTCFDPIAVTDVVAAIHNLPD